MRFKNTLLKCFDVQEHNQESDNKRAVQTILKKGGLK